jgi:hypothetical protein
MRVQVLDGSVEAGERSRRMLGWDVSNGVARSLFIRGCDSANALYRNFETNIPRKETASLPISKFMYLRAINIIPRSVRKRNTAK